MRTHWALSIALWALSLATFSAQAPTEGFSTSFIDRSVDACTDFYQFACGNWLTTHPVPADRSRYGRLNDLADRNVRIVRAILEDAATRRPGRTSDEQKIGDAFAACMDDETIESRGASPVLPLLRDIERIESNQQLIRMAARFTHDGFPSFLTLGSQPDPHDSTTFIATIGQGAMGLPDRDLYLNDDERSRTLRREYQAHIERMFVLLAGSDPSTRLGVVPSLSRDERTRPTGVGRILSDAPTRLAQQVLDVETAIARATMDRVAFRDPRRRDNPTTIAGLRQIAPDIDFGLYVRGTGAPAFTRLNLLNPDYLKQLNAVELPLESWKAYMKWRALEAFAPLLSVPFQREAFHFTGEILSGQKEMRPRWMRCSDAVAGEGAADALGEIVGRIFMHEHFGPDAGARMDEMISALQRSLRQTLSDVDWMSPQTRINALAKLEALRRKIGGPDRWRDFRDVTIRRDDHAGNAVRMSVSDTQRQLRWIGQAVDRSLWLVTPQTVNAYYSPLLNEVTFPAGILQPPVFDARADDAVNFGAAGAMIGHELTHGFDDSGRRFDSRGSLMDWWTPRDDEAFRGRASCVASQYSGYPAVADVKLNGNLTLGENVADNGGVRIAFYALMEVLAHKGTQPAIEGFTPEQRFFLSYAQLWCENATDQDFRRRAQEDVHASGRWRANGVLQNMPEFRKAFGCRKGAPMAPVNACRVW